MVLEARAIWIIATGVIRQHGTRTSAVAKSRTADTIADGDIGTYEEPNHEIWRGLLPHARAAIC
jgi:hypothetical protein